MLRPIPVGLYYIHRDSKRRCYLAIQATCEKCMLKEVNFRKGPGGKDSLPGPNGGYLEGMLSFHFF